MEWDLDGSGTFAVTGARGAGPDGPTSSGVTRSPTPGTWFPTVRVAAQRDGDQDPPYARLQNLARVRVVVS